MSHVPYYGQTEANPTNRSETYEISTVTYNSFTDEYFIVIPDDVIEFLKLVPGDTLTWSIKDEKVYIEKKE